MSISALHHRRARVEDSRFAKSDDDVSSQRDVREKHPKKLREAAIA
jgi:hypothetical protein